MKRADGVAGDDSRSIARSSRDPGRERALVGAAIAAIGVAAHVASVWGFTIDDAFIVQRYADRIAAGRGWTMNDGPSTDGITSLPFGAMIAAARVIGLDGLATAKVVGALCTCVAAAIVVRAVGRRSLGRALSLGTGLLVVGASSLCVWSVGGLETGIATLASVLCVEGALARPARTSWVVAGAAVLPWLRPECLPVPLAVALSMLAWRRRTSIVLAATSIGSGALLLATRMAAFGHALPLSARAKPADLSVGLDYVLRALLATTSGVGVLLALAALGARRDDRARSIAWLTLVAVVFVAGGDWMPSWRLLVPALPFFAAASTAGSMVLARRLGGWLRSRGHRFARRAARSPAVAVALGSAAALLLVPVLERIAIGPPISGAIHARATAAAPIARWIRAHARTAALVDVGYLAYLSDVEVVDLGGLTDPEIADAPGGYLTKRIDPAYLAARDPDVVLLHATSPPSIAPDGTLRTLPGAFTVERTLAETSWLRNRYRVERVDTYSSDYLYVALVRRR